MKKLAMTICLVAFFTGGCNYIGVTGGSGGDFNATNFTVEYGSPPPGELEPEPGERDWMLTSGFLVVDNAIDTGFFESSPEMGGLIKLGMEVEPDTGLFVNVLGGLTFIKWASYWDEGTEWYGLFGGGVTYFIDDKDVCILAGYDNRRGFTAGVGYRF